MAVQLPKTIRQWFTPEQACVYLSQAFECDVETSDLNYFVDEHKLSVFFRITETYWTEIIQVSFKLDEKEKFKDFQKKHLIKNGDSISTSFRIYKGEHKVKDILGVYYDETKPLDDGNTDTYVYINPEIYFKTLYFHNQSEGEGHQISDDIYSHELPIEAGELGYPRHELDRFIKAQTEPTPETKEPKPLSNKERNNLISIISVLRDMLLDPNAPTEKEKPENKKGKPPFKNEANLIEFLEAEYGDVRGCSKNNLAGVFKASRNNE